MDEQINEHWMKKALLEAERAFNAKETPVGAVVVKDGSIIGRGYNQVETLNDATAHAEMIAITAATNTLGNWRLSECSLYVTKEPCTMCCGAIVNSRINFIGFGAYDKKRGGCSSQYQLCNEPSNNHKSVVKGGILEEDCSFLLKEFYSRLRRES
jgi:tRNA(adenine34) deaminase